MSHETIQKRAFFRQEIGKSLHMETTELKRKKKKERQQKITAFDMRTSPGNATIFFTWRKKKINRWRENPCNDLLLSAVCTESSVWVAFFFFFTPLDFNSFYSQNYFCYCSQWWSVDSKDFKVPNHLPKNGVRRSFLLNQNSWEQVLLQITAASIVSDKIKFCWILSYTAVIGYKCTFVTF